MEGEGAGRSGRIACDKSRIVRCSSLKRSESSPDLEDEKEDINIAKTKRHKKKKKKKASSATGLEEEEEDIDIAKAKRHKKKKKASSSPDLEEEEEDMRHKKKKKKKKASSGTDLEEEEEDIDIAKVKRQKKKKASSSPTDLEAKSKAKAKRDEKAASRAALVVERAMSRRGPNYRALLELVRDRYKRIQGSSEDKLTYSGAEVLKGALYRYLEEERKIKQPGSAEKFCKRARSRISKAPLGPPEHLKHKPDAGVPDYQAWKRNRDSNCAKAALACYNKRNPGAVYELVEPITSQTLLYIGDFWHHVNFMAKPRNDAALGSSDASPKLFFAELNFTEAVRGLYLARNGRLICRCCIVDPNSPETIPGCGHCDPSWETKIYHVRGSFRYGRSKATTHRMLLLKPQRSARGF